MEYVIVGFSTITAAFLSGYCKSKGYDTKKLIVVGLLYGLLSLTAMLLLGVWAIGVEEMMGNFSLRSLGVFLLYIVAVVGFFFPKL
jgi:hypothetical protein